MSEVETEIKSNRRLGGLIKPALDKSLKTKALRILSAADLESFQLEAQTRVSLADIRELAAEYALIVQTGEAATHAAGVLLNCPVASNDRNALVAMQHNQQPLPPHVFRAFDIFLFLHAEGHILIKDLEQIRTTLRTYSEHIPSVFKNCSVESALGEFERRIVSGTLTSGSTNEPWASTFVASRIAKPLAETNTQVLDPSECATSN